MVIYLKHLRKPVLAVLLLLILVGTVWRIQDKTFQNLKQYSEGKPDDITVEAFMAAIGCFDREDSDIEIFDIEKGEVVKKLKMDSELGAEAEDILNKITGMYVKVKAFPDKGYIAKIPLKPAVEVSNKWLNEYGIFSVNEVFIIFPGTDTPYLLVLDSNYRPLFFNFEQGAKSDLLDKIQPANISYAIDVQLKN